VGLQVLLRRLTSKASGAQEQELEALRNTEGAEGAVRGAAQHHTPPARRQVPQEPQEREHALEHAVAH
jgi:hypothetical protein